MAREAFIGLKGKKPFFYPIENIKKHVIALGSSGSGKTVFSKILIEECAMQHVPSIVVDIQGDLSALAIRGTKKELESYGLDREVIDRWEKEVTVTIYTPVSSKGISICINPLEIPIKQIDKEELTPMLHEISAAIAKLIGYSPTNDKGKFASSILFAALEYSFNNKKPLKTFGRLISLLKNPPQEIETVIAQLNGTQKEIDLLTRKVKFLDIGEKKLLFQFGVPLSIDLLLGRKVNKEKTHISVLYLNTLPTHEEKEFFIATLASKLYQWMLSHPTKQLQATFMIDEIAPFIPAGSEKPISKPPLKLLFKQARKYGVGCIIATQNPGDIDYKAFAQFGTWAIGRLTVKQDIKKVSQALKSLSSESIDGILPKLKPGQFVMFAPDVSNSLIQFSTRWLYTKHTTLTEEDIKHLMQNKQALFEPFKVKIAKEEKETKTERVFSLSKSLKISKKEDESKNVDKVPFLPSIPESKARKIAHNHQRKLFWKFGPTNEQLLDITTKYHPYLISAVKVEERFLFGFVKTRKVYHVCVDGITGQIIKIDGRSLQTFDQTEKLFSLTEKELQVARYVDQAKGYVSDDELVDLTNLNKKSINSTLSALLKKKIVTFQRVGKFKRWYSSVSLDHKFIFRIASRLNIFYRKKPDKKIKTIITSEQVERFVRLWFDKSIVLHSELAYAPKYVVTYAKDKKLRKISIDGITSKITKV